jgi:hypothetical protein
VTPPARHATQADQASSLGGNAVGCDQLLLLAEGIDEPERMSAESDDRNQRQQRKGAGRARGDSHPFAPPARSEHDERQHQPRRDLDSDAHDERERRPGQAGGGAGRERERGRDGDQ